MTQQTTNSTAQKVLTVLKWIFSTFLIFFALGSLIEGAFLSSFLFLLAALLLAPPLTGFWRAKLPFLHNKVAKGSLLFVLFIIALVTNTNILKSSPDNKTSYTETSSTDIATENKKVKARKKEKEMDFDDKEDILIAYIKKNTSDKSLQNISKLGKTGEMFDNGNYSTIHPHDGYIKAQQHEVTKEMILQFDPRFNFDERSTYLKKDTKNGTVENYIINFEIDNKGNITSKKTLITYSKAGTVEYNNDEVPDYETFINKKIIEDKNAEIEAQVQIAKETKAYEKRKNEFEKNCISSWDGSHTKLKRLIKENMNDPDSFEHVETLYKLYLGYAIVVMKFRGKNAFNATIVNSVTAKVSLEDCSVLEVEQ